MNKFKAVYINELDKIKHRKVATLFVVLMCVAVLAMGVVNRSSYIPMSDELVAEEQKKTEERLMEIRTSARNNLTFAESRFEDAQRELENKGIPMDWELFVELQDMIWKHSSSYVPSIDLSRSFSIEGDVKYSTWKYFAAVCNELVTRVYSFMLAKAEYDTYMRKLDIDALQSKDYRGDLLTLKKGIQARLDAYDYLKKYEAEHPMFELCEYILSRNEYKSTVDIANDEDVAELVAQAEEYERIVAEDDFEEYIEIRRAQIQAYIDAPDSPTDGSFVPMDKDNYRWELEILNYRMEAGITGIYESHNRFFEDMAVLNTNNKYIENGVDKTGTKLTAGQLSELARECELIEFKVKNKCYDYGKNNIASYSVDTNISVAKELFDVGQILLTLCIVVIAASIVSKELETGSVKLLMVVPVKRRKIMLAKMAALGTVALAGLVILAVTVIIGTGIAVGFDGFHPYVMLGESGASGMSFLIFVLLYALLMFIPVMWYGAMALQLSSVLRNTAASMMLSISIYVIGIAVMLFAPMYVDPQILKYIPTVAVANVCTSVFSYGSGLELSAMITNADGLMSCASPVMSVVYTLIMTAAMLVTSENSVCHRDIK